VTLPKNLGDVDAKQLFGHLPCNTFPTLGFKDKGCDCPNSRVAVGRAGRHSTSGHNMQIIQVVADKKDFRRREALGLGQCRNGLHFVLNSLNHRNAQFCSSGGDDFVFFPGHDEDRQTYSLEGLEGQGSTGEVV